MNALGTAKDHIEWVVSTLGAAAVTYLARRRGAGQALKGKLTASWLGQRLDVEGENAALRAAVHRQEKEIADLNEAMTRLEAMGERERAASDRERAGLVRDAETLLARIERLTNLGEGIKKAHDAGALVAASAPPSTAPTSSPKTSPTSSKRSSTRSSGSREPPPNR